MVIPRVLRGASLVAQEAHFSAILDAAPQLPAVIYNSPTMASTRADLFFKLRGKHPNLIGFRSSAAPRTCATPPSSSRPRTMR